MQLEAGNLTEAERAYRSLVGVAKAGSDNVWLYWARLGLGEIHVSRGDLGAAMATFRKASAIAERLAKADPGNAGWQRDLSVSHEKIGDVLRAQGNLPGALESYRASLAIIERLAKADPGNAGWQRDLSVSHEQDRRRAAGSGQPAWGAGELPRLARHRRAPGQGRPRQCRLAARPLGVA